MATNGRTCEWARKVGFWILKNDHRSVGFTRGPQAKIEYGQGVSRTARFSIHPEREWYPIALSQNVKRKPLAVTVLGRRLVVYRSREGKVIAHRDRCPHRNVPLSGGRCLSNDTLECPYHGWQFRPDGACTAIPGSVSGPKKNHRVETFSTREQYGLVWVCPSLLGSPECAPLVVPEIEDKSHSIVVREVEFPAGLHAVVENALDVPHTSILHRGLFRGGQRNRVSVILRRYKMWAEAEYKGEPPPSGLVARLLSLGASNELKVQHWDRFILPGTLQVEYRLGAAVHFLITGFCCPVSPDKTKLFAVVCMKTPLWLFLEHLLARLVEPFAMKLFQQDVAILGAQSENVEYFGGESYMSTDIDVLGTAITRLLKQASERELLAGANGESPSLKELRPANEEPKEISHLELDA